MAPMDGTGSDRFHIGPIRPPSEAGSLLLQVSNGCSWNRCKFCQLYRHTRFRAYRVEQVKEDIDAIRRIAERVESYHGESWDLQGLNEELACLSGEEQQSFYMVANWLLGGGENVFLQDGNTLVLSGGKLTEVLRYLKEQLPSIRRITSYGRAENLSHLSGEDFAALKEAGLDRIHCGFESGSDAVLALVNKGTTAAQQIAAGRAIKAGGIELSVYFMPGLGGAALSEENARGMAHVANAVAPDFLRIRTCAVKPGTELEEDLVAGRFRLASEDEKIREIRLLLEETDYDGRIVSDHIINLLPEIRGHVQQDKEAMLETVRRYLAMEDEERRVYQMARRLCLVERPEDLASLPAGEREAWKKEARGMSAEAWEEKMNAMIARYI